MFSETYRRQAALVIKALPLVAEEPCFALKGGTAINLFLRNMPRLSVDIDLTYLPVLPRDESLAGISAAMKRIAERVHRSIPRAHITQAALQPEKALTKLLVRTEGAQIKIEVTPVLGGCVYEPEIRTVSPAVEEAFGFAEMRVVSRPDLFAGKIVAALDRQHPRDFFDVRDLLANEGLDKTLRRTFLVYLLSHNRPMHEILAPKPKSISHEFLRGLQSMIAERVTVENLMDAREELIDTAIRKMPQSHRRFLISFERGAPDWRLLQLPVARDLPAVRWRQQNLERMPAAHRSQLVSRLEALLLR